MLTRIVAIASNTFRESVRSRVLVGLLCVSLLLMVGSYALSPLMVGEGARLTRDLGMACLSLFGALIAIAAGMGLVYREIEHRTIYNVLSKPVRRFEFIVGKFFGLFATVQVNMLTMAVLLAFFLAMQGERPGTVFALEIILVCMEVTVLTAISVAFSVISSPVLGGVFTLLFYIVGHSATGVGAVLAERPEAIGLKQVIEVVARVVPNFELFSVREFILQGVAVDISYIGAAMAYGLAYIGLALLGASLAFENRDIQ